MVLTLVDLAAGVGGRPDAVPLGEVPVDVHADAAAAGDGDRVLPPQPVVAPRVLVPAVQYSTVQYSTVQYSTVQYTATAGRGSACTRTRRGWRGGRCATGTGQCRSAPDPAEIICVTGDSVRSDCCGQQVRKQILQF